MFLLLLRQRHLRSSGSRPWRLGTSALEGHQRCLLRQSPVSDHLPAVCTGCFSCFVRVGLHTAVSPALTRAEAERLPLLLGQQQRVLRGLSGAPSLAQVSAAATGGQAPRVALDGTLAPAQRPPLLLVWIGSWNLEATNRWKITPPTRGCLLWPLRSGWVSVPSPSLGRVRGAAALEANGDHSDPS